MSLSQPILPGNPSEMGVPQQGQPVVVMQEGLTAPKNYGIYGTDKFIQPMNGEVPQLLHKAQFVDVLCDPCCKPAAAKKRTYMHSEQPTDRLHPHLQWSLSP